MEKTCSSTPLFSFVSLQTLIPPLDPHEATKRTHTQKKKRNEKKLCAIVCERLRSLVVVVVAEVLSPMKARSLTQHPHSSTQESSLSALPSQHLTVPSRDAVYVLPVPSNSKALTGLLWPQGSAEALTPKQRNVVSIAV